MKQTTFKLTPHQQEKFNAICAEVDKGLKGIKKFSMVSYAGFAGVGKTFLLTKFIQKYKDRTIQLTTPTHKSLAVANKMIKENNIKSSRLETSTIHSFLKLKIQNDYTTGKIKLLQKTLNFNGKDSDVDLNTKDILILDESSMCGNDLFQFILDAVQKNKVKVVLFTGDPLQLPPVEDNKNIIFDIIEPHMLTKIVRQAQDNPIIERSMFLRKCIDNKEFPNVFNLFKEEKTIHIHNSFSSFMKTFLDDPSNDKVIGSYTNTRVDKLNHGIRQKIYGKDVPDFLPGENIVLQDAITEKNGAIDCANGEIVTIESVEPDRFYRYNLDSYKIKIEESKKDIFVISQNSLNEYNKILKKLSSEGNKLPKNSPKRKKIFKEYFLLKDYFTGVKHIYASTIHKLQGSTFENVYIDLQDISKYCRYHNSEAMDMIYRLLYVAFTRASNEIHILQKEA